MFDFRLIILVVNFFYIFIRSLYILNIIFRRFIYFVVGLFVGLLVIGLYWKIFVGFLGFFFGDEYDVLVGMLDCVRKNFLVCFVLIFVSFF